jgi:hypothetical protein
MRERRRDTEMDISRELTLRVRRAYNEKVVWIRGCGGNFPIRHTPNQ